MDEQDLSADGAPEPPAPGQTTPMTPSGAGEPERRPGAGVPQRRRRAETVRRALASRGAGWVVATALAGAVIALSVVLATAPAQVVRQISLGRPAFAGPALVSPACRLFPLSWLTPPGRHIQVRIPPGKQKIIQVPPGKRVSVPIPAGLVPPRCLVPLRMGVQVSP